MAMPLIAAGREELAPAVCRGGVQSTLLGRLDVVEAAVLPSQSDGDCPCFPASTAAAPLRPACAVVDEPVVW